MYKQFQDKCFVLNYPKWVDIRWEKTPEMYIFTCGVKMC